MPDVIRLADLGVEADPGTDWHPRPDKTEARDDDGNLRDLTHDEVLEHQAKPEVAHQVDAGLVLAAEDSTYTDDGVI